jgi:hypothetical protein
MAAVRFIDENDLGQVRRLAHWSFFSPVLAGLYNHVAFLGPEWHSTTMAAVRFVDESDHGHICRTAHWLFCALLMETL